MPAGSPFVERLSRETGLDFKLKVYEKMSDFEDDMNQEAPDLIFSNPIQAAHAFKVHGYFPLCAAARRSRPSCSFARIRKSAAWTT